MKSLALPNQNAWVIHNKAIAKKGTKKTALRFKPIIKAVKKDANITDHQGKNCDNMRANMMVAIKFRIFFLMVLVLSVVLQ